MRLGIILVCWMIGVSAAHVVEEQIIGRLDQGYVLVRTPTGIERKAGPKTWFNEKEFLEKQKKEFKKGPYSFKGEPDVKKPRKKETGLDPESIKSSSSSGASRDAT